MKKKNTTYTKNASPLLIERSIQKFKVSKNYSNYDHVYATQLF